MPVRVDSEGVRAEVKIDACRGDGAAERRGPAD
jgi:hypothetical protein